MKSTQLERNIISAVLSDKEKLDDFIQQTETKYFTDQLSSDIREYLVEKYLEDGDFSITKLAMNFDVEDLIKTDQPFFDYENWIEILKERHYRRELIKRSKNIYHLAKDENEPIDKVLHQSQEEIFSVTSHNDTEDRLSTGQEALMKSFDRFNKIKEEGEPSGLKTGFVTLDEKTAGLQKGHLFVLAGRTSEGKTSFATAVVNNVLKQKKKVAYLSLEMNDVELTDRLIGMNSYVKLRDYINGRVSETQQKAINHAFNVMDDYDWFISYKRGLTVEDIKAISRKQYNKMDGFDLLVVDYLQRIKLPGEGTTNKEVGTVANRLRDLAGELDVPLLLLSQLNRDIKGRPKLKNLRDSGEIEESADEVGFVYDPKYHENKNKKREDYVREVEFMLAKGRTSGTGIFRMSFYPQITLWQDRVMEEYGKVEKPEILTYQQTRGKENVKS